MCSTLLYGTRTRTSHSYVTIIRRWMLVTLLQFPLNYTRLSLLDRETRELRNNDVMRARTRHTSPGRHIRCTSNCSPNMSASVSYCQSFVTHSHPRLPSSVMR